MPKKTYVKIDGTWRNVKAVWVKVAGVWRKVIPKGNIGGVWKEFIQYATYLYNRGVDIVSFVTEKFDPGGGWSFSVTNSSDLKLLSGYSWSQGYESEGFIRTSSPINITEYSKLKIQLGTVTGPASHTATGNLSISVNPKDRLYQTVARTTFRVSESGKTIELDLSSFSGNYYIRVGIVSHDVVQFFMEVESIWLE